MHHRCGLQRQVAISSITAATDTVIEAVVCITVKTATGGIVRGGERGNQGMGQPGEIGEANGGGIAVSTSSGVCEPAHSVVGFETEAGRARGRHGQMCRPSGQQQPTGHQRVRKGSITHSSCTSGS